MPQISCFLANHAPNFYYFWLKHNMNSRRKFIKRSAALSALVITGVPGLGKNLEENFTDQAGKKPVVISTWDHGLAANAEAWKILNSRGKALDAVEKGVMVTEDDFSNLSVGLGGLPDREGIVTLDASIMDENGRCGGVAFLERIKHPVSVARMVMEKTPHVLMVGSGAQKFALENGFKLEPKKLSPAAEKAYKEWLKRSEYKPKANIENHDTIGMVAIDAVGNLSGSCTTSGLAYKMRGRVGDSPIIGAGMYVDNEVGAACATGVGETVLRICGSYLVVELMRQGLSPMDACKKAIERLVVKNLNYREVQVGFLALNKKGEHGAFAVQKGFTYALADSGGNKMFDSDYFLR
ncbi:isoaspartyl peptidase/L-asparaginase family protein [Nitrosomonas sp. Nm33]|uniref:isoaspartyl peptidase/L-asparaginase family protein n=1 Tax=Nitrosomonas sp. Nm33 TaxID=133724 RepID=UPI001C40B1A8|nr:N(4)-(beta-N-acetylglucosaminyl)-L-asparaginase [Nitrosomonas sp. Nm33]